MQQTRAVDVWLIDLESEAEIFLSPDEELRAARLVFAVDRARWIRARSALRAILTKATSIRATELRFRLGPHGKPALTGDSGVEFSLSHAGSWAMVAVTERTPVGVDIERMRDNVNMATLLNRLGATELPETQAGLFRAWTRREAMTKAIGGALMETPIGDFRICDLEAPPGYCASLALTGHDPLVRRHIL